MIGYTTIWTNKFDEAIKFYDNLLWEIWAKRFIEMERFVAWSRWDNTPGFSVTKPFDKESATIWNGSMIALEVNSIEEVNRLYNKAIELGWIDDGKPWSRGDSGFYAWYFRDLDWNKLNFYHVANK